MEREVLKRKILKSGISEADWNTVFEPDLDLIYSSALQLVSRLPSIGFLSRTKRLNSIYVIFEYLDLLIDSEELSVNQAMSSYLIARNLSTSFDKAHTMFVIMAPRMSVGSIPSNPIAQSIVYGS